MNCIKVLSQDKIISGSWDKTVKVWCLKTERCTQTINAHSRPVNGIQVLSNKKVLSYANDKKIKIWDLITTFCIKTFQTDYTISSMDLV